ncbi:hypothetical protein QYM36_019763 [Artemia franciscana]|uniref:Uncharacterized protein n=1 Tax=Artemia franciscana TaxID=6661 RepID=A0AA88H9U2_ARTSF|nr:hypothetical protein QYM36_019763 [Artemia franciscana]
MPFKTTSEVTSVQHFKNILTEEMRSKYGFDVGIDIEGCGIESFLSCDWMDYSSEEEFIKQVLSNPKHGRIISRGQDVVPVWDLIKDQYPVQAEIIRNAWIENEKEMSGDGERRRLAAADESERRRDESERRAFRLKSPNLRKKVKKASGCF